ncbi:GNAT family N-acetyltransferase [Shinella curvata]|uniref:GNAT family N-acetyltransferase n=1 Tax=Shinella curvata TaxID=1817964 RepID=A0ABT8XEB4_9HYPH|nr:GNAT family N-acetyltransferase [Shinella curvata]MCJ8054529.1 GNAT family N-acetyltransferase [Shinella curvata]MDO6121550.1 GNAT family N-acetyltransferase [Shinella curvata]
MTAIIRIDADFQRWDDLLALILEAFAYMDGIIDPPSSAHLLTPASLAARAQTEIAYMALDGQTLLGCIFCRPEPESLYIGKLAVAPFLQGRGVGRLLLEAAEHLARDLRLPVLRLETRIELTGNHATFARWGFVRTAENAHPGFTRITSIEMRKPLD